MIPTNIHRTPITATKLLALMGNGEAGPFSSYLITEDSEEAMSALRTMLRQMMKRTNEDELLLALGALREAATMAIITNALPNAPGCPWLFIRGDTWQINTVNTAIEIIKAMHQKLIDERASV